MYCTTGHKLSLQLSLTTEKNMVAQQLGEGKFTVAAILLSCWLKIVSKTAKFKETIEHNPDPKFQACPRFRNGVWWYQSYCHTLIKYFFKSESCLNVAIPSFLPSVGSPAATPAHRVNPHVGTQLGKLVV